MEQNSLNHSGVRGQKWGVRRYQNKDGTLTNAGEKRVAKIENEHNQLTKSDTNSAQKRSIKDVSDEELRSKINRLQMEKQFSELTKNPETKKGKSVISDILMKSGQTAASTLTTAAFTYMGKQVIKKMAGDSVYNGMFNVKDKKD